MSARSLAGAFCLLLVLAACHRKATPEDCTQMLDRYVEMTLAADPQTKDLPPAQAAAAREMKKAVKKAEPSYAKVEKQCEAEVTRSVYSCAMSAKNPDEWEACIE
jgi:hypothetical protein